MSGSEGMKTAVIIGAGPAGLTAALELLRRSDIRPIVLEKSDYLGGLSRTVNYKGNRIDIGGHRFFSKSDRVMNWWQEILPLQHDAAGEQQITYQQATRTIAAGGAPDTRADPAASDQVMLLRPRRSRIFFLRRLFDYPIRLSVDTLAKLGLLRTIRVGCSYLRAAVRPFPNPKNLEQFFINRFGRELYLTFFKSYTEKVWGIPCSQISAEWGQQRVKGLSLTRSALHFLKSLLPRRKSLAQKDTETSLIEQFLYPKFGPGQMWEEVARQVRARGGVVLMEHDVEAVIMNDGKVTAVQARDRAGGKSVTFAGDYFFSTMPMQELVRALQTPVPPAVKEISDGLVYRDFITVGLLLNKLRLGEKGERGLATDNWVYIQEPDVSVGRLQIFNNWSPFMVADPEKVWVGLEYFCNEGDELWTRGDAAMAQLAEAELKQMGMIDAGDVLDATVIRMPKTYPAYWGAYERFDELRAYLDAIANLFLVGRNGMHRYNNQDHSMLTAITAVDNILAGRSDKANIWAVNTEQDYHESKAGEKTEPASTATGAATAPAATGRTS